MSNDVAPDGMIFVCMACGKSSTTRYGFTGDDPGPYKSTADPGWDESCMMNASLITKRAYEEWRAYHPTTRAGSK